jgi:hypothetical protein
MNQFRNLGVKPVESQNFIGDKIKMSKLFDKTITVHDYKIEPSKFPKPGCENCMYMQISVKEIKHIVFTTSKYLISTIKQIPKEKFPFETTIIEANDSFQFT